MRQNMLKKILEIVKMVIWQFCLHWKIIDETPATQ